MTLDNDQATAKHELCSAQSCHWTQESLAETQGPWGRAQTKPSNAFFFHLLLYESGSLPQWDQRCGYYIWWWYQAGFRHSVSGTCSRIAEFTSRGRKKTAGAPRQPCQAPAQPHANEPPGFWWLWGEAAFSLWTQNTRRWFWFDVICWQVFLLILFSWNNPKKLLSTKLSCDVCMCAHVCVNQRAMET